MVQAKNRRPRKPAAVQPIDLPKSTGIGTVTGCTGFNGESIRIARVWENQFAFFRGVDFIDGEPCPLHFVHFGGCESIDHAQAARIARERHCELFISQDGTTFDI